MLPLTPAYQYSSLTCKYLLVFRDVSIDWEQHVTLFAPSVQLFLDLILIPEEVIPPELSGMSAVQHRRWGRKAVCCKRSDSSISLAGLLLEFGALTFPPRPAIFPETCWLHRRVKLRNG